MCIKRRSWLGYWYALIFCALVIVPVAHAFLPALVAESAIGAIVGRIIINRAARVAANDAVYLTVVNGTEKAISKAAVSQAAKVTSKQSIFKNVSGALTWAGIGHSLGSISTEQLLPEGVYSATSGTKRDDGRWDVTVAGQNFISDFEPTEDSPFLVSINTDSNGQVIVSTSANDSYPLYIYDTGMKPKANYISGYDVQAVANTYFQQQSSTDRLICSAVDRSRCSFGALSITSVEPQTSNGVVTQYIVKGSYPVTIAGVDGAESTTKTVTTQMVPRVNTRYTGDQPITNNGGITGNEENTTNPDFSKMLSALDTIPLKVEDLTKSINDLFMAGASQPDYEGVPITSSNPVTADEVRAAYPDVDGLKQSEWLKPAQVNETSPLNVSIPSPTAVGTSENPAKVDLGEDPGVGTPDLEDIPTAEDILNPVTSMFSGYEHSVQLRDVQCPVVNVDLFGHSYVIDSQCQLSESNKSFIKLIFLAFWGFLAFRIVMEA